MTQVGSMIKWEVWENIMGSLVWAWVNFLRPNFILIIFKESVRTACNYTLNNRYYFPARHKRHISTLRREPRICVEIVMKKSAFTRNRISVTPFAFSRYTDRATARHNSLLSFVKASVHYFSSVKYIQMSKLFLVMGCPDLSAVRTLLLRDRHLISTGT